MEFDETSNNLSKRIRLNFIEDPLLYWKSQEMIHFRAKRNPLHQP